MTINRIEAEFHNHDCAAHRRTGWGTENLTSELPLRADEVELHDQLRFQLSLRT